MIELESSLTKLTLHPTPSKSSSAFKKPQQPVAESWEDEELDDSGDEANRPLSPQQSSDYPCAPPPTPISPTSSRDAAAFISPYAAPYGFGTDGAGDVQNSDGRLDGGRPSLAGARGTRPEKTDAVAKRLIAGALGVRAPKKTEEQRQYDRAVKEKEMKRRNREKEDAARAKDEAEKAKAAVWDD